MAKFGHMSKTSPLTVAQAADVLGVSIRTVHRMIDSGTLVPLAKLSGATGAYLLDADHVAEVAATRRSA